MIGTDSDRAPVAVVAHEAMATTFEARIRGVEPRYARQAAQACFVEVDRLEQLLSRFVEGSDVHRINRLRAGESIRLSEECHACLRLAEQATAVTGGLFDVTRGRPDATGRLVLHPDEQTITCGTPGRELDLGGIGKGFALDRLRPVLADWEITDALLSAGGSTVLAVGEWPVTLRGTHAAHEISLRHAAVSGSGTAAQGAHIIAPPGMDRPYRWQRVWVRAGTGALSDALATAAFLMDEAELRAFAAHEPAVEGLWAEPLAAPEPVVINAGPGD